MKRNIYKLLMSALFVSAGLTSCLNDDNIDNQDYGLIDLNANKIIEIPAGASHEKSLTLLPEGVKEVTIGEVRLAAEKPASEDIVVSLTTANTADIVGSDSDLFPLDGITIPASVTIPKGERSVALIATINTALLQSNPQYVAISITSVDKEGYIISGNFGYVTLNMKIKHKYEGRYVVTGTMDHLPSLGAYVHVTTIFGDEPYTVQLQTLDGSRLLFYEEMGWEDYIYGMATASGGYSGWGSFCPVFTFDDNGNITEVTNYYGQPASNTRSAVLDPAGVNKYDPATKSFQVSYYMVQPSVVTTPPHYRCHMVETYTFLEDL
ncbi:hypothetical protein [Maribellus sp. YY47]|uniref:hypothetical protein n=1 Tax=Maribellus sp. YY47 TaxID=2929486 RepID=UPI002001BCE1|nr:hypothetical protein [Maribellus sp. YY47]MCK3684658.1 hypothetical protein [Maribellus sp. YY47]